LHSKKLGNQSGVNLEVIGAGYENLKAI